MPLTWPELLDQLRRADLLVAGPASGPSPMELSADSRSVRPGSMYLAMRGSQADGHRFIPDAVRRGASAVVVETAADVDIPQIVVRDGRRAALVLGAAWFGHPARRLTLVGVTGTNGKTTTTGLLRHLLNAAGTSGSIGTLGAFDGMGEPVSSTAGTLTTPGPVDLQATLAALVARGVDRVTMETSSHSLDQGRLDGLSFAAAVFTNLTRDHLDYHGTMESYLSAKLKLGSMLTPSGVEVVNLDDPAWQVLAMRSRRVTFGLHPAADVRAAEIVLGAAGSRFRLEGCFGSADVVLPLLGDFNVANALAAAAGSLGLGVSLAEVAARLSSSPQVPGRMELLSETPCVVLRDYAHTPDALERALATLRPLTTGRLVVVFGCGGDRDKGKRPLMGRIAAEIADLAIVTSDNPRTENPGAIIDDIEQGMGGAAHVRIPDRLAAIHTALEQARPGDTLLLAGKGHETYQILGTEKVPFDEREIVTRAVNRER
ncbi:MAG TPA: UDP-N-acetylmuramoyl-L-alanyl-D-glutamate--2,6-diaminopimelate ligase [Gemmatimonadales bacterium]|jgi:UDP-N-acetylmuramoyl-L-alanyl-D-glutamate--2,6-diaminopimelate ligase|nr:UDP-N-acetylmuramoyl-L-alanyl-D-glutamate--2,6-diaminopimelate ligase [Gemmatimonadales bacterium]